MSNEISSKDHLGQTFPSLSAMARHWHLKFCTVWSRLEVGWSMKDALTTPPLPHSLRNRIAGRCSDHKGRQFASQIEMCAAWDINVHTYRSRRLNGWSVEDALTRPVKKAK